jgi:hypothetical protein
MRNWLLKIFVTAAGLVLVSGLLFAHHGTAPYDTTKLTTVTGTVMDFQFINPHVEIYIEVKNDKGKPEKWAGEANSPNVLARNGWSRNIMHAGDTITLIGNRAKNGANSLRLQKVVLASGRELDPNATSE